MNAKRKPNWTLCVKESERAPWRNIGAAWETEKGNLFLRVDEGERLEGTAMLFPYRERPPGAPPPGAWRPRSAPARPAPPPSPSRERDYMDRKREERRSPFVPPSAPTPPSPYTMPTTPPDDDDIGPNLDEPDWL